MSNEPSKAHKTTLADNPLKTEFNKGVASRIQEELTRVAPDLPYIDISKELYKQFKGAAPSSAVIQGVLAGERSASIYLLSIFSKYGFDMEYILTGNKNTDEILLIQRIKALGGFDLLAEAVDYVEVRAKYEMNKHDKLMLNSMSSKVEKQGEALNKILEALGTLSK